MGSRALFDQSYNAGRTRCLMFGKFIGLLHCVDPDEPELDEDYDLASGPQDPLRDYWVETERHVAESDYEDALFEVAGYRVGEYAVLDEARILEEHSDNTPRTYLWGWEDEMELESDEWASRMTRYFELRGHSEDDWLLRYDEVHNIHVTAEQSDNDFDSSEVAMISQSTRRPYRPRNHLDCCERRWRLATHNGQLNGMPGPKYYVERDTHGWRGRHQRTLRDHRRRRVVW